MSVSVVSSCHSASLPVGWGGVLRFTCRSSSRFSTSCSVLQVGGAVLPHVRQSVHLLLHRRLLHTVVSVRPQPERPGQNRPANRLFFTSLRLNLRELDPLAAHMRWFVWLMAAAGTIYVFVYHERWVHVWVGFWFWFCLGVSPKLRQDQMESSGWNTSRIWQLNVNRSINMSL